MGLAYLGILVSIIMLHILVLFYDTLVKLRLRSIWCYIQCKYKYCAKDKAKQLSRRISSSA